MVIGEPALVASDRLGYTSKWMCGHRPEYAAGKMLVNVTIPLSSDSCTPRR